ncbi:CDK9 kinase, partial [Todus mexicanus]|nr:CDK9 kinase [Todus mexicanus]
HNCCKGTIYLVFDFCEHDLAGLLSNACAKFMVSKTKKVMQMLLNELYYTYRNEILYQDLKAANVLMPLDRVLKTLDWLRLSVWVRTARQTDSCTNWVITLWYRLPEPLLGKSPPINLWGTGCFMADRWTHSPIMQGNTEQLHLTLISQICRSITSQVWLNMDKYELYQKLDCPKSQKHKVKDYLKAYVQDPYALNLINKLLVLDPTQQIDNDNVLSHDVLWSDPMFSDLKNMLSTHNQSVW